ncbi:MAG TPA: hypothetical protein VGG02_03605 [Chthoniobacterales bacterium]
MNRSRNSFFDNIWNWQISSIPAQFGSMRRKAIIGVILGAAAGCLVGAITEVRQPAGDADQPYILSLNQRTGRPQLHVRGQPELK